MNNISNSERDSLVSEALGRLPKAPEHGADFWTNLEDSLDAQTPTGRGGSSGTGASRLRFRVLAAAAVTLIVGLVSVSILNDRDSEVIAASATSVRTTEVPTTNSPKSTAAPEVVGLSVPIYPERAESELFLYDVPVPAGFETHYATGRGISQSMISDEFTGSIEVYNYSRLDPDWVDQVINFGGGELLEQRTVRVPLYEKTAAGLVDEGVFLEVEQFTYQLDGAVRVERSYNFNDRVINAAVTLNSAVVAERILDDIRMYNAAFVPIDITQCSALGDPVPEAPDALNDAQADRFEGIVQALVGCNWEALEDQLDPSGFTATFGGEDAIEVWQDSERYGEPILEILLSHMGTEPGFTDAGAAAFPRPHLLFWEEVTDQMKQELVRLGYTEDDFKTYEESGYVGYRTGIDADGTWQYFVAGD